MFFCALPFVFILLSFILSNVNFNVKRVIKRHENKLNLENISNNLLYEKNISINHPGHYNNNLYQ
jgi:hypothetical protein